MPGPCSMRSTRWSTGRWWPCWGRREHRRRAALPLARNAACLCTGAPRRRRVNARPWAPPRAGDGDAVQRNLRQLLRWLHRRRRLVASVRARPRQRTRCTALGRSAAGDASTELTIAATVLRALPPSLHSERMALADACDVRLAAQRPCRSRCGSVSASSSAAPGQIRKNCAHAMPLSAR